MMAVRGGDGHGHGGGNIGLVTENGSGAVDEDIVLTQSICHIRL